MRPVTLSKTTTLLIGIAVGLSAGGAVTLVRSQEAAAPASHPTAATAAAPAPVTRPSAAAWPAAPSTAPAAAAPTTGPATLPSDAGRERSGDRSGDRGSDRYGSSRSGRDRDRDDDRRREDRGRDSGSSTAAAPAPGGPSTMPEIRIPPTKPMDPKYQGLLTRSVFTKGRARGPDGRLPGEDRPSPPSMPKRPEQELALRGITFEDDEPVAFIENTASRQISMVRLGEPVARGRVASLTLSDIEYEADGNRTKVPLGHTLDGVAASGGSGTYLTSLPSGSPGSTSASSPPTAAAGPGGPPTTGPAGGGEISSIEERMRRRRAERGG